MMFAIASGPVAAWHWHFERVGIELTAFRGAQALSHKRHGSAIAGKYEASLMLTTA